MGVHPEVHKESVGFVEIIAAPQARRRWSEAAKGRIVAATLVAGVKVSEVARRHGVSANHLSTWRSLARKGRLVVPDLEGAAFPLPAVPVAVEASGAQSLAGSPDETGGTRTIDLVVGPVTLRLDPQTPVARLVELVLALRACA